MKTTVVCTAVCLIALTAFALPVSSKELVCLPSNKLGFSLLGETLTQLEQQKRSLLPAGRPGLALKPLAPSSEDETQPPQNAATGSEGVELAAKGGLAALIFRNGSGFSPYLGAGATLGEDDGPFAPSQLASAPAHLAYKLGAGVDCTVNESTRLRLGYGFYTNAFDAPSPSASQTPLDRDDGHHFSMDLKLAF